MMSHTLLVSLLALANAEEQNPLGNWITQGRSSLDSQSSIRGATDTLATSEKCEAEAAFFEKGLGTALLENPEFDKSKVKIALTRNKKYIQVDHPFSHEANALSLAQVDVPEEDDDEAKAGKLREKIRKMHAWSELRITKAEKIREAEFIQEQKELDDLKKKDLDAKIDVYYVNMDNAHERKNCLERQFKDMPGNQEPIRYPALQFPSNCNKAKTRNEYQACLLEAELGDCFEAGIDFPATGTHGTQLHDEHKIRSAVLSNWCGHKRLFKQLEEEHKNGTAPQYVVVLEDDVILDRKYFFKVIKDFVKNYPNRDWDAVQLDPFGHKDRKDFVELFRGKPVFKPAADSQCSAYWGFHAVLVKTSALPRMNKWMSNNKAVPIDWLPWRMPHFLAYSALVSRNPEAQVGGNVVVLPQYCSAKVMKTTIG